MSGNIGGILTNTHTTALIHTFCDLFLCCCKTLSPLCCVVQSGLSTIGNKIALLYCIDFFFLHETSLHKLVTPLTWHPLPGPARPSPVPSKCLSAEWLCLSADGVRTRQELFSPVTKRLALCLDQRSAQCNRNLEGDENKTANASLVCCGAS